MFEESRKKLIIWGAKGHAKVLWECLNALGQEVVALFDNNAEVKSPYTSVPIFYGRKGFAQWCSTVNLSKEPYYCLVAIGGSRGADRHRILQFLWGNGLLPFTVVHPTAFCADSVKMGKGSQVLTRAVVGVDAQIGEACIVNTAAIIDHDVTLSDGVHICPGAHVSGEIEIGTYTMIGTGATILPKLKIGSNVIVGAGSVVTKNVENDVVVCGNPARVIRENVQKISGDAFDGK